MIIPEFTSKPAGFEIKFDQEIAVLHVQDSDFAYLSVYFFVIRISLLNFARS